MLVPVKNIPTKIPAKNLNFKLPIKIMHNDHDLFAIWVCLLNTQVALQVYSFQVIGIKLRSCCYIMSSTTLNMNFKCKATNHFTEEILYPIKKEQHWQTLTGREDPLSSVMPINKLFKSINEENHC